MPKLRLNATELQNPDVNRVSLVKRGANRIPFRLMKEDNEMTIDLHKIGRTLYKSETAPAKPAVVAAVVRKGAEERVMKTLKETGVFAADEKLTKTEDDVSVTFAKEGAEAGDDAIILKMNDDVALVVTNLKKAFSSYSDDSTSFTDVMKTSGFYPSVSMAASALQDTIYNIMWKAESPSEASTQINSAVASFQSYLSTLASSLPTHAFKADDEIRKSVTVNIGTQAASNDLEGNPSQDAAKGQSTNGGAGDVTRQGSNNDIEGNPSADAAGRTGSTTDGVTGQSVTNRPGDNDIEGKNVTEQTQKGDGGTEQKTPDIAALMAEVQKSLKDGIESVTKQVQESIGTLKKDFEGQLGEVREIAKKADEAVNGTVHNGDGGDKTGRVRKTDGKTGAPPLLDTALDRSHLKVAAQRR